MLALDSTYQIKEQEQAVVTTFGKPSADTTSGLHFKIPLIQKVHKVNTTIQGFPIGYTVDSNEVDVDEAIMITSDYNFVDVDFFCGVPYYRTGKIYLCLQRSGGNIKKYGSELYPYSHWQL